MSNFIALKYKHTFGALNLDVDIKTDAGVTAIIGPSGAGKSSLLNLIAGITQAKHEQLTINGKDLSNQHPQTRKMGYVFQEGLLFPHMNVKQNLLYGATKPKPDNFDEVVELFNLKNLLKRQPHNLSGGEARRVAIARALCSQPDMLLLDEPLSGIDPNRRESFFPYLEKLRQTAKIPIFYVSHQIDEVMRLAHNVVVMNHGKVALSGKLEDIATDPHFTKLAGNNESSVVLSGQVTAQNGLCELSINGGKLLLSHPPHGGEGQSVRTRIFARDVAIATSKPENLSVLNVLKVKIEHIQHVNDTETDLTLTLIEENSATPSVLLSRITKTSCERLNLSEGLHVWAMIKAVAILN